MKRRKKRKSPEPIRHVRVPIRDRQGNLSYTTGCGLNVIFQTFIKPIRNQSVAQKVCVPLSATNCPLCLVGMTEMLLKRRDAALRRRRWGLKTAIEMIETRMIVKGLDQLVGADL